MTSTMMRMPIQLRREPGVSRPEKLTVGLPRTLETQAQANHGQSLDRLAQRGGLDPIEVWFLVKGRAWGDVSDGVTYEQALDLVNSLKVEGK